MYLQSEDITHVEIRTDFIRTVIVDTRKFFVARAGIELMISLVNEVRSHTLLTILINHRHKFNFRNFFLKQIVLFLNFIFCTATENV